MKKLAIVLLFLIAIPVASAVSVDNYGDKTKNDVIIPQDAIVEYLTDDAGGGDKKNFKFSATRPFEIYPDEWCVIISSDVHSDYVGNMPVVNCFDDSGPNTKSSRHSYVQNHGLSLSHVQAVIGKDSNTQKKMNP